MSTYQILACAVVALFYGIYFQRQLALRRRGIHTARLGRGQKDRSTRIIEIALLAISFSMPIAQVASIVWVRTWLGLTGALIALVGVVFFLLAVVAMRENWRAGIDASQKTELVTCGIYRVSRNPAFVGFDLFYIGITVMFPSIALIVLTVAGIVIFHLQIVREERYVRSAFGRDYAEYSGKVRRYL